MNTPEAPLSSRRIFMTRGLPAGLIVAKMVLPPAAGLLGLLAHTVRAEGAKVINNPRPPVLANGSSNIPWAPLCREAGEGYTVQDDGGIAESLGHVIRASGRTDLDPQGQLRARADALANHPERASIGFCPGAIKFALAGPLIQGGITLFGKYISEFNRKGAGAIVYSANGLRQLDDGSFVDFGSSEKPITPKEFHMLVRDITELGIPFAVNTKTQRYGLPWWRAASEAFYSKTRFGTISGILRVGEYLKLDQEGRPYRYIELPFEYRLNTEDPNDAGSWLKGNERIWAAFQVSSDLNAITTNRELRSTRNLFGGTKDAMDAAGLIFGTKVLA